MKTAPSDGEDRVAPSPLAPPNHSQLLTRTSIVLVSWGLLVLGSLAWNLHLEKCHCQALLIDKARTHIQKDMAFRLWAARHGGVYVPADERTPPNDYLAHIPERDIVTPSGKKLTLMNPAYLLRQLNEESATGTISGHITSLKLLRPGNAPDTWERKALLQLEAGRPEVVAFNEVDGVPWLRLMLPLHVENEHCLQCHAHQGYNVGDLRGGISASVSMAPYLSMTHGIRQALFLSHGLIWLLGTGGIGFFHHRGKKQAGERLAAEHRRQEDEQAIRKANRLLKMLSECNQALVHAESEASLLMRICHNIVDIGKYRLAWVGFAVNDEKKSVHPVAQAGFEAGYLESLDICWGECARGQGPTGKAIRTGRLNVITDIVTDPRYAPWRDEALNRGYASSIALPLTQDGKTFGALNIYSPEANAFTSDEIELLIEMADDLAYGIQTRRTEQAHRQAREMLRLRNRALEANVSGILISENQPPKRPISYVNPAFEKITGYREDEVLGRGIQLLLGRDYGQKGWADIEAALETGQPETALIRNYRKDGTLFWNDLSVAPVCNDAGEVTHFVNIINDVSDRKQYEDELAHKSNFDELTGLPNRNLLNDRMQQAIAHARRHGESLALLLIDLDRFQVINDSLGHNLGNELLKRVAERLGGCTRAQDTLARLGGDEFVALFLDIQGRQGLILSVERILEILAPPFAIGQRDIRLTACIGISLFPQDGEEEELLLRNADLALFQAKKSGQGSFRFFTPEMDIQIQETLDLETDLRRALEREEFLLYFQPKVAVPSGRIIGSEALIRWQHPERGLVSPGAFIPLAEETGLIEPLGTWVLREACRQCKAFHDQGLPQLPVAVNISARQFRNEKLVEVVKEVLEKSGLEPRWLELELTESMVMDKPEEAAELMAHLRQLGVSLSLDDFGTGYSSLNYLCRFPVDRLKIDRTFISDVAIDPSAAAVAESVVAIAHNLQIEAVAEGVENEDQLAFLRSCHCDVYQGFLYSRPLPAQQFGELLQQNAQGDVRL